MRSKKLLLVIATIGIALLSFYVWAKSQSVSRGYEVEAEFAELPPDDVALEDWLEAQPGVARVIVGQRTGEPNVLAIVLIIVRTGWDRTPFPDLNAKCDELGYKGRVGMFRDSPKDSAGISPREPASRSIDRSQVKRCTN